MIPQLKDPKYILLSRTKNLFLQESIGSMIVFLRSLKYLFTFRFKKAFLRLSKQPPFRECGSELLQAGGKGGQEWEKIF